MTPESKEHIALFQVFLGGGGVLLIQTIAMAVWRSVKSRTPEARRATSLTEAHSLIVTAGAANAELRNDNERLRQWMLEQRAGFEEEIGRLRAQITEQRTEIATLELKVDRLEGRTT